MRGLNTEIIKDVSAIMYRILNNKQSTGRTIIEKGTVEYACQSKGAKQAPFVHRF